MQTATETQYYGTDSLWQHYAPQYGMNCQDAALVKVYRLDHA